MNFTRIALEGSRVVRSDPLLHVFRNGAAHKRLHVSILISVPTRHNAVLLAVHRHVPIRNLAHFLLFSPSYNSYSTVAEADNDRQNSICWKCRKMLSAVSKFFCEHCEVVLPPAKLTKFEVMNMAEDFNISIAELQKAFKDLQRIFHPDKFTLRSDTEKQISEMISSLVNVSYKTLLDPLKRGVYLLKLKGITISEETQLSDPEFLMEVMELNEKIAANEDDKNMVEIQKEVQNVCEKLIMEISAAFKDKNFEIAKALLIKLRYYNNMADKLKHLIPPS